MKKKLIKGIGKHPFSDIEFRKILVLLKLINVGFIILFEIII